MYVGDSITNNDIIKRIKEEITSLTALSIVNIIFGAISIAMGVSSSINHLFLLMESAQMYVFSIISLCFGCGIAIVGIYWIISSVGILDFTTDIYIGHNKEKIPKTDESITDLIVQMVAFYRKEMKTIKRMIVMSKIGGCLFISFAFFSAANDLMNHSVNVLWPSYVQIFSVSLMVCLGIVCFFIPKFFVKYASIWDGRILETKHAEKILIEQMGSQ